MIKSMYIVFVMMYDSNKYNNNIAFVPGTLQNANPNRSKYGHKLELQRKNL